MEQPATAPTTKKQKMIVGWFTFTCSEDSTILFAELLNDHFDSWTKLVEFRYLNTLKSKNSMENLDVAFIEGAISSDEQAEKLKKIRANAKYVVAIGACACTGLPSSSRNTIPDNEKNERMKYFMEKFNYAKNVRKLEDIISVDDKVEGCPMDTKVFLEKLVKYLQIFNLM